MDQENVIEKADLETNTTARSFGKHHEEEEQECLKKLKIWMHENLMAPHGMDRFIEEMRGKNTEGAHICGEGDETICESKVNLKKEDGTMKKQYVNNVNPKVVSKILAMISIVIVISVIAVTGQVSAKTLTDNGNGSVTDSSSRLMWQLGEVGVKTMETGIAYCKDLSLAGYNDWRLPVSDELMSLVDRSFSYPTIDVKYFPAMEERDANVYWSSTQDKSIVTKALAVAFYNGSLVSQKTTEKHFVRCVRSMD
jgi:hypothetical protein